MTAQSRAPEPLLEMRGVVKRFPGVVALGGVDLDVAAGEVHCLLGQNGAGKSTLIKVLAGVHQPDEGQMIWQGGEVRFTHPQAAMEVGVATMYQELDLVPGLTVAENIMLGHEMSTFGFSQRRATRARAEKLLRQLGHSDISPTVEVSRLSAASQQIVSMARALSRDVKVMVMDEPSAVLDSGEVEQLFAVVRELTAAGVAVIYISHRLEEIREIGDRVTILKDGKTVATGLDATSTPKSELIRLMTGRAIEYVFPPRQAPDVQADPLLTVEGLTRAGEFDNVSFEVHPGEVVGIAGLVGAGRSEILETIFGARRADAGSVHVEGRKLVTGSVPDAVKAGVGLCPEERKSQALVLGHSVANNISLATFTEFAKLGFIDRSAELESSQTHADSLELRPNDISREMRTLSGGNQQKVVLARWLQHGSRILLLDEPTRGVDVGARSEIYGLIQQLSDDGRAVVIVSSEIPEVLGLSDRVLVLAEGVVLHDGPAADLDEHKVLDIILKGEAA